MKSNSSSVFLCRAEEELVGFQMSPIQDKQLLPSSGHHTLALSCSLITAGETFLAKLSLSLATVKLCPQRLSVLLGRLLTAETKLECTSIDPPLYSYHLHVDLPIKCGRKMAYREEIGP